MRQQDRLGSFLPRLDSFGACIEENDTPISHCRSRAPTGSTQALWRPRRNSCWLAWCWASPFTTASCLTSRCPSPCECITLHLATHCAVGSVLVPTALPGMMCSTQFRRKICGAEADTRVLIPCFLGCGNGRPVDDAAAGCDAGSCDDERCVIRSPNRYKKLLGQPCKPARLAGHGADAGEEPPAAARLRRCGNHLCPSLPLCVTTPGGRNFKTAAGDRPSVC